MSIADPSAPQGRPSVARRGWLDRWMSGLRMVGNVQAWIILTLFYLVVITPIGVLFRCVADPLRLRGRRESNWQSLARQYNRMEEAVEQS